ncbi:hypothetical protein Nepgr_031829 [Nepenthes gracilis]|uniref:Uncharacterized protein n=1 Tax=Nepenthes gracilis TaxID=150966 RepID=A0AAD3Y7U4_NEPGR|nr:hypothetical protein Nepgr_031829 [Nepenthes gracilis]
MEETTQFSAPGSRHLNFKKSFKLAVRSLLTACLKEDFCKAFPQFTPMEHERLYGLFIQVIMSLHENIEDEFESLCRETQVGHTLDTVEQLVEGQNLDPLFSDKTNVGQVKHDLSASKKNEILFMESLLDKTKSQSDHARSRIELLSKKMQDNPCTAEKLRMG